MRVLVAMHSTAAGAASDIAGGTCRAQEAARGVVWLGRSQDFSKGTSNPLVLPTPNMVSPCPG